MKKKTYVLGVDFSEGKDKNMKVKGYYTKDGVLHITYIKEVK